MVVGRLGPGEPLRVALDPVRPRRRRNFVFKRMSLDEVNELIKERGGCFVVTDEPDFCQFDMASLVKQH